GDLWAGNFENTKRLADRLSLTCKIEESRAPFVLSTAFWCRTHAMKPLFSYPFSYEDFADESMQEIGSLSHSVERILPYVAQHQGYYSGIVMNADYAALNRANLQYLLEKTVQTLKENRVVSTIADVRDYKIRNAEIRSFSERFLHVLIYGVGHYGKQCGCMLIESDCEFDGFVVSDGQYKTERFLSHPVYYLSEVVMNPNACGMILMVGKRYQDEILEQLRAKGYENIYVLV
ncbi:MAG: rhamnan synthesis F family protein, partial [Hungatella sp.]